VDRAVHPRQRAARSDPVLTSRRTAGTSQAHVEHSGSEAGYWATSLSPRTQHPRSHCPLTKSVGGSGLTLHGMRNRASVWNLLLSLMAFVAFMVILLTALGFGVGTVELMIWLVAIVLGVFLIVRRYRSANAATQVGAKDRR